MRDEQLSTAVGTALVKQDYPSFRFTFIRLLAVALVVSRTKICQVKARNHKVARSIEAFEKIAIDCN